MFAAWNYYLWKLKNNASANIETIYGWFEYNQTLQPNHTSFFYYSHGFYPSLTESWISTCIYMYIKSLVVLINITVIYLYCQLPVLYVFRTYPKANICSLFWIKRTRPILCIWIIFHIHPFNPHEGSLLSCIWFRDTCMRCSNLFVT